MTVAILISGSIFKEPTQRTGKTGRPYTTCTIKAAGADNASSDFWSVLAFGDTASEQLLRLTVGERCSIQGVLKLELYVAASDGKTKISRTIFADHVLAVRQPPKERRAKAAAPPTSQETTNIMPSSAAPFDDEIPF